MFGWAAESNATLPARFADLIVAFLGIWGVIAQLAVYFGASLYVLFGLFWLPFVGSLLWCRWTWTRPSPAWVEDAPGEPWSLRVPLVGLLLTSVALAANHAGWLPWPGVVVLGTAYLASFSWVVKRSPSTQPLQLRASTLDIGSLVFGAVVAVAVILLVHRPGGDDGYYLNAAASALDHPDLPVLSFDGMHGDTTFSIHQRAHRGQTYALLVATVAWFLGVTAADVYYQILPVLWALLVPLAGWLLLKTLSPKTAWLGGLVLVVVLLAWSGSNQSYGNYAFVRIFQGKSIFVSVMAPLIAFNAARFAVRPSWATWGMLLLAQAGGAVFTSSALVMGPICAAFAVIAFLRVDRRGLLTGLWGATASTPLVASLLQLRLETMMTGIRPTDAYRYPVTNVLNDTYRAPLVLFVMLTLPVLASLVKDARAEALRRWVGAVWVVLWSGALGFVLAENVSPHFSWRVYWTFSLPIFLALAFALAAHLAVRSQRIAVTGLAVVCLVAFIGASKSTLHEENLLFYGFANHKVLPEITAVADRVMADVKPGAVVLAARPVAIALAGRQHKPALIAIRFLYLKNMKSQWGAREGRRRARMLSLVTKGEVQASRVDNALRDLQRLCVSNIVAVEDLMRNEQYVSGLGRLGFEHTATIGDFVLFAREPGCSNSLDGD